MKKLLIFLSLCLFSIVTFSQNKKASIAFYNVENLFDTLDAQKVLDDEFTPDGEKKWTTERYNKKLNNIAKVISSLNDNKLPSLVGFAEIENQLVLEDLIQTSYLSPEKYQVVHEESPDVRGIDVALIYAPGDFKYIKHQSIPIPLKTKYKVRDILYVKGILLDTDTLHVFVNHWKSRSGGQKETEPQRIQCALTLRTAIDSIMAINRNANIIVMGDLNDTPSDKSVFEILQANNTKEEGSLYNLMLPVSREGLGTHSYRGEWSVLDHIIVSNNLVNNSNGLIVEGNTGHIFSADWITYTSKEGNKSPNRTYGGPNYYGGYSDHYPVYVVLSKQ